LLANKKFGLKHKEYRILELLWLANKPLSVDEIAAAVGTGWTKLKKQQNVKVCLNKLQKLGLIDLKDPSAYYALYTKRELDVLLAKERTVNYRENSMILRLKQFLETDGLSEEDVEELKKLLYEEAET
jgi:predicted transcriptional regulator